MGGAPFKGFSFAGKSVTAGGCARRVIDVLRKVRSPAPEAVARTPAGLVSARCWSRGAPPPGRRGAVVAGGRRLSGRASSLDAVMDLNRSVSGGRLSLRVMM
jgi:hypothetical protein